MLDLERESSLFWSTVDAFQLTSGSGADVLEENLITF